MNVKTKEVLSFINKNKIIILVILLVAGLFYWFGLRPMKIRQDCSWVKRHTDAVPVSRGVSGETDIEKCLNKYGKGLYGEYQCGSQSQPAKDWYDKANKEEYNFCLHEKGL